MKSSSSASSSMKYSGYLSGPKTAFIHVIVDTMTTLMTANFSHSVKLFINFPWVDPFGKVGWPQGM